MKILAIDPGPVTSACVIWGNGHVYDGIEVKNETLLANLAANTVRGAELCAIEMIACYGMPVGKEVFETCVWIGRFRERAQMQVQFVYRADVKMHLCHSMRAKDANIRQALIDKHGPVGTKKSPGKLYGISGHLWAALAVADFAGENNQTEQRQ